MILHRPERKRKNSLSCAAQKPAASTDSTLMQNQAVGTRASVFSVVDKWLEVCGNAEWESDGINANWNHSSDPLNSRQNFKPLLPIDLPPPLPNMNAPVQRADMVQTFTPPPDVQPEVQVFGGGTEIDIEAEKVSI